MADNKNKVKVRIRARQTIHYDQTVTMTLNEWERIKSLSESEMIRGGEVEAWLNLDDISDCDNIDDDFEMEAVDEGGLSLVPPDYYGMDL